MRCHFLMCVLGFLAVTTVAVGQDVYYVNGSCGDDGWSGLSEICSDPDGPRRTIQSAIDTAASGDEIRIAAGLYQETLVIDAKSIVLVGVDGAATTVIDAARAGETITCTNTEDPGTVLSGLTITGGVADCCGSGAGVSIVGGVVTITDCIIEENYAIQGGGIGTFYSTLYVTNSLIHNNEADTRSSGAGGGGIMIVDGLGYLTNCRIVENSAAWGGGLFVYRSQATVAGCLFEANNASGSFNANGGSAIFCQVAQVTVVACTIVKNRTWTNEDALAIFDSDVTVVGTAIAFNSGYGLSVQGDSALTTSRNILWDNWRGAINGGSLDPSDIEDDPMFVDELFGDYRLQANSPAIDAGDNTALPAAMTTDLDRLARYVDDPNVPDTGRSGNGHDEIVDMGAYEHQLPDCPADFNKDGILSILDFIAYLNAYNTNDPSADFNEDGIVNTLDFLAFLNAYSEGCE